MTSWELLGVIVWGVAATYTALCIFVPELRIYWKQTDKKLGTLSSIGVAVCVWAPTLVLMGVIPSGYGRWVYCVVLLGGLIAVVGGVLDVYFPLNERKR